MCGCRLLCSHQRGRLSAEQDKSQFGNHEGGLQFCLRSAFGRFLIAVLCSFLFPARSCPPAASHTIQPRSVPLLYRRVMLDTDTSLKDDSSQDLSRDFDKDKEKEKEKDKNSKSKGAPKSASPP